MSDTPPTVAAYRLHIRAIAESPLFAYRARLAHESGLLVPLLAGDEVAVSKRLCELLSTASVNQFPAHQPIQARLETPSDRHGTAPDPVLESSMQTDELS